MPFISRADKDNVDEQLHMVEVVQGRVLCRVIARILDDDDDDVKGHEHEYINYEQYDPNGVSEEFRARIEIFLLMVLRLADQLGMASLAVRYAAAARKWRCTWGQIQQATDLRSPAEARDVFSLVSVGGPIQTRRRRPRSDRREEEASRHVWPSEVEDDDTAPSC